MQSTQAQLTQAQAQAQAQPVMTRAAIAQAQASYDTVVTDLRRLQTATQPRDRAEAKAALDKANAAANAAREDLTRLTRATQPVARTQARAALDQSAAALRQAQENLNRLKQASQPQALAEARTALERANSDLVLAEKDLARQRTLLDKGYVAPTVVEAAVNKYDTAKAALATAQERVKNLANDQAGELHAAEAQVEQAQAAQVGAQRKWESLDEDQTPETRSAEARVQEAAADLVSAQRRWSTLDQDQAAELAAARSRVDQARAALQNAQANSVQDRVRASEVTNQQGQVTRAQAAVDQTRTSLGYTTITAPRDGVIIKKDVEEGTIVTSGRSSVAEGMAIVELGDLNTMFVDVQVDETDLADIRAGQKVEIEVESIRGKTVEGSVTRVDPQATTTTNITTVKVEIEVLDHDKRLIPGLTATCRFVAAEKKDVLTLPTAALQQKDGKWYAVVPGGSSPRSVLVEVGLEGDDQVEIVAGLNEGDEVVVQALSVATPSSSGPGGPGGGPPPGGGSGFLKQP